MKRKDLEEVLDDMSSPFSKSRRLVTPNFPFIDSILSNLGFVGAPMDSNCSCLFLKIVTVVSDTRFSKFRCGILGC